LGSSQPPTPAGRSVNILGREAVARGGRIIRSGETNGMALPPRPGGRRDVIGCSIRPAPEDIAWMRY